MAFIHSPKIVTDGLVLALDAGNTKSYPGSGTAWFDKSGRGNNGILVNGPTFNTGSLGSIVFDGVNDYVNIGTTDFGIIRDFTISFWTDITKDGAIQIFNKGYNSPWGIYIDKQASNVLSCQLSFTSGFGQTNTLTTNYSGIKNWVVVRNNTSLTWYVNGSQDNTSTISSLDVSQSLSKQWRIGSNFDVNIPNFKGNLYNFLVYNKSLSPQEVLQNYNATKGRFGL
jgi:hypothetical protein